MIDWRDTMTLVTLEPSGLPLEIHQARRHLRLVPLSVSPKPPCVCPTEKEGQSDANQTSPICRRRL